MVIHFIPNILPSLGPFEIEIYLDTHESIREILRCAKLIFPSNDHADLEKYSYDLLLIYIVEQVVTFPNSKRVIQLGIVVAGDIFDSVALKYEIIITNMPPVQHSALFIEI